MNSPRRYRSGLRPFTWVILAVNVLLLLATMSVLSVRPNCDEFLRAICEADAQARAAQGFRSIISVWAAIDVILGVLWLVTRQTTRQCPVCGSSVPTGAVICGACGFDYRRTHQTPAT